MFENKVLAQKGHISERTDKCNKSDIRVGLELTVLGVVAGDFWDDDHPEGLVGKGLVVGIGLTCTSTVAQGENWWASSETLSASLELQTLNCAVDFKYLNIWNFWKKCFKSFKYLNSLIILTCIYATVLRFCFWGWFNNLCGRIQWNAFIFNGTIAFIRGCGI